MSPMWARALGLRKAGGTSQVQQQMQQHAKQAQQVQQRGQHQGQIRVQGSAAAGAAGV